MKMNITSNKRKYKKNIKNTIKRKIGGDIIYELLAIEHYTNQTYNKKFPKDKRQFLNGEFIDHKAFKVVPYLSSNIFGYIIQKVEKTTDAFTIINGITHRIENIEEFTSGYVKYMNDSYYELFFILDGESTDADNFQNGAILEYTYNSNNNSFGPDDNTDTKGLIKVKGTSWFIKADKDEVIENYNIYNTNNNKMNLNNNNTNNTVEILGTKWILDKNTPANGLPYINTHISIKAQKNSRNSNILEHNVEVKWDTTKARIKGKAKSETESIITKIA